MCTSFLRCRSWLKDVIKLRRPSFPFISSVATHDASTQLPLTEFFIGCILSNDPSDRQALPSAHCNAGSASPPQPPEIGALCSSNSASHASDGREHTPAPHVLLETPPGLEKYARQYAPHGFLVKAAPVRPRLCTSISVPPPQPRVSTTQVGSHPVRSAPAYKRSASTALAGTHNPVGADPRAGTGPFLNGEPLFFLWSNWVNTNLTGSVALTQLTAISCIINTVSLFCSGIQDRPAGTPPILSRRPVESSMRLFFKKPVLMSSTSLISALHTLTPRTSLSCSTRTHLRARPHGFRLQRRLHKQRYAGYGPNHRSRPAATPLTFWNTDGYILLCTHPHCRGQET